MDVTGETVAGWVSRMVQIPSVNPLHAGPSCGEPGERAFASALAEWFADLGAEHVELDDVLDGRPNVYARFPGRTDRLAVVDAHTDTVTVEHMVEPPFDGRITDGHVHGRGALDTKASLGVMCALLEDWQRSHRRPRPGLLVVGSVGEEAGGLLGATRFRGWVQQRGLTIDELVVCEPTQCRPVYGHKGGIGLQIVVTGVSAHSSTPELGANAVHAAARLVTALEQHHEELTRRVATTDVGSPTLLVSVLHGGVGGNVVPDRCELTVGRRLVPGEDPQAEFDALAAFIAAHCPLPVQVEPVYRTADGAPGSPAFYSDPSGDLVLTLARAAGTEPATAPFGTNALRYNAFAAQACVFGPGSIDDAHRSTERVAIDDLARTARAYTAWLDPG